MSDITTQIKRAYSMEPHTAHGELTNEEGSVGLMKDQNDTHIPVESIGTPADEVEYLSRDGNPDLYKVNVDGQIQYYQVVLVEPLLQILDRDFEDAFLFMEMFDRYTAARVPLPTGEDWNVMVGEYHKRNE